jgi:hypothetical protein
MSKPQPELFQFNRSPKTPKDPGTIPPGVSLCPEPGAYGMLRAPDSTLFCALMHPQKIRVDACARAIIKHPAFLAALEAIREECRTQAPRIALARIEAITEEALGG